MNYTQSTVSSKHQTVIPAPIRRALKLHAGDRLLWRLVSVGGEKKVIAESEPKNWAQHTRGLAKHLWEDVDIDEYIKQLRNEWDR